MRAATHRQVLTAIILTGGKASRIKGKDKASLKIGKDRLINILLRSLKKIFKKIIIVTNSLQRYRNLKGVKVVPDVIPHQGPLGGIYSGLLASKSFYSFVLACDMPFLNLELIKYMISRKDNFDAVVPKLKKGYEALFAIYSKNCLSPVSEMLSAGNLRVSDFFNKIKLRELNEEEVSRFGDPEILFMNINTKADLLKAEKMREAR